jgi:hypothetical protein
MKTYLSTFVALTISFIAYNQLPYSWTGGVNPGWTNTGPLQWRAGCGYVTTNCTGNYNNNVNTFYTSPIIDATCSNPTVDITFTAFGNMENGYDFMIIEYSLNNGVTWINPYGPGVGWTGNFGAAPGSTIPPISVPSTNNLRFRFNFVSDFSIVSTGLKITDFDINCISPLPIELAYFTGKNEEDVNKLSWLVNSEQNNDYFTIERSSDGTNWDEIDRMDGAGTSTTQILYNYEDKTYPSSLNYYRIKQTDYDGKFTFSNMISIDNSIINDQVLEVYNTMGQKINLTDNGLKIIVYKNGKVSKRY